MQLFGTSGIRRVADRDLAQLALNVMMSELYLYPPLLMLLGSLPLEL